MRDLRPALAAKLHRKWILEPALGTNIILGRAIFPRGTARGDFVFEHSIDLLELFSLLRGSHEGRGFAKVILPEALVVRGGKFSGLVLELQVLEVFVDHQPAPLQVGERSDIHRQGGRRRAFTSQQRHRHEYRHANNN